MRNIQRLMALHDDAVITISHQKKRNLIEIGIAAQYTGGFEKGEVYSAQAVQDIHTGSILEALEKAANIAIERLDGCVCLNPGDDDGSHTCWLHHDCRDGSCTHGE